MMRKSLLLGGALALAAGAAHADPVLGMYVGAGALQSNVDNAGDLDLDIHDKEWKLFAGIKPVASPLGFEAEYVDFGSITTPFAHTSADAWAFDAIGHLPLPVPFTTVYAKAGLSRWDVSGSVAGFPALQFSDTSSQFTYGAGVQVQVQGLGARLEYEHFNIADTNGANVFTIGVLFSFL
jgi:OmpA-OmpF porin, OOP family